MPIEQVWALVMVLVGVTILVIIDDFRRSLSLKSANEEITVLRKQLDVKMREYEESISNLNEIHLQEITNLNEYHRKEMKKPKQNENSPTSNGGRSGWSL